MNRSIVSIGGVPEHFNLPFYQATSESSFDTLPYGVTWTDVPAGTGAMCAALDSGELDVAVLLTEGIVAHIAKGSSARLIGSYTRSPLVWGVHTAGNASFESVDDLEGGRFAISRYGSGSHLMAVVQARTQGWKHKPEFVVAENLDGGRAALAEDRADAFMWERTMSKPLVDSGEWKRVDDFSAPWPAFMIAASPRFLDAQLDSIPELLATVRSYCERLFADKEEAARLIAERFHLGAEDARAWMDHIQWSCSPTLDRAALTRVAQGLLSAGVLETLPEIEDLCAEPAALR